MDQARGNRSLNGASTAALEIRELPGLLHGRDDIHGHVEALLDPCALVVSLFVCALTFDREIGSPYLILSLIVVMLTFPGRSRLHVPLTRLVRDSVIAAVVPIGLLITFGWATGYLSLYSERAALHWLWIAPACLVGIHIAFRLGAPLVLTRMKRCVIVGMNEQGVALAKRIRHNPFTDLSLVGFFDDRQTARSEPVDFAMLGRLDDVASYAMAHRIHVIYLSLPMATQDRTMKLLDRLRDTTASIYFVPDQFVTELIQCRTSSVVDIPVVAVCETPFVGLNGVLKRASDIALSAAALIGLSPVFALVAILVKLDSPGPAIFRQRRYGLDGKEIEVYKFRSMRVEESSSTLVLQAQRNDARVTKLGAFLRRTSLDELPQFVNVLQGRMSLVGPRPHAIAHNEMYRKLIKGYMVRHKVRPGITGWAQVNGLRGGTETVDKMAARIQYDIDYLRHWSLRLDFHILVKTVAVIFNDRHAY